MRPPLPPAAVALLACPVCGAGLAVDPATDPAADPAGVRCACGHAFDRARQGHLTLLPPGGSPHPGDSAAMVADRVDFLTAGHYAGVTAALADAVLADGPVSSVLDLGGGTGAHLAGVLDAAPGAVGVCLDVSRYAARRAARAHPRAMAVVADTWAGLPVRDGALDRVLVVFAPRNGPETARVLAPGGRLVVVTPTADHLRELVGPLVLLSVDPAKAERLAGALEPHLVRTASRTHREVLHLERDAVRVLVGMGPHARHLSAEALAERTSGLADPVAVTVAVDVTTYRRA